MIVTLRDVANRAGVSPSTVSRVIRGEGYTAPSTRENILKAIEELQYRPSNIARHLRYGRTYAIGFILNDISNPFFSHAVKGAEQFLRNQMDDYELLLFNTNSEPDREIKAIEFMLDKHAEAIILASTTTDECMKKIREVVERYHIPIVSLDNQLDGLETGIVTVENQVGAYQLTSHLLQHGHRRIGFISGPSRESHVYERLQGCKQAVHEYGFDFDKQLISYGNWTVDDGYSITIDWLGLKKPPTAILGLNNFMCMGALSAITQRGLKVPDQIALASFDDVEFGHLLSPSLTTLDYSYQKIGEEAVRLAMNAIETAEKEVISQLVRVPVSMIVRESCGCST